MANRTRSVETDQVAARAEGVDMLGGADGCCAVVDEQADFDVLGDAGLGEVPLGHRPVLEAWSASEGEVGSSPDRALPAP
jgi:hypothetical protein